MLKSKNVLVTGGSGYIGSHTVRVLIDEGYTPIVFDNLEENGGIEGYTGKLYIGDLRSKDDLEKAFKNEDIDAVIHFAAYASVPDSIIEPDKYYENNIIGGLNLLNIMRKHDVNKLVFSSSAAVYGEPQVTLVSEDHPKNPLNPYGHTKLVFEQILQWYKVAYDFTSLSLRYFCAAGASSDGIIGELHKKETHVIPSAILTALGVRETFYINGTDYETPDGTAIRDFVHVDDLAKAHILGIEKLADIGCDVCNVGIGKGFSVREIVDSVKRVSGVDFRVEERSRRVGDPSILIADNEKIKKLLGWTPVYTEIDEIVASAFRFYKTYYAS